MRDIAAEITRMIADKASREDAPVMSDPLNELGLDSLQVVELTYDIEERFNVEIPFNANFDIEAKTVADLVQTVERLVAAKAELH